MADLVQHARDLIARSRAGDQNAMAIIALVGENARSEAPGNIKAKISYNIFKKVAEEDTTHGEDQRLPFPPPPFLEGLAEPVSFYPCLARAINYRRGFMSCVVAVANGPKLDTPHLTSIVENIKECCPSEKGQREAMSVLRYADRIQQVRAGAPIGLLSREAAWEMGEE